MTYVVFFTLSEQDPTNTATNFPMLPLCPAFHYLSDLQKHFSVSAWDAILPQCVSYGQINNASGYERSFT